MKLVISFIITLYLFLAGCGSTANEDNLQKWIKQSERPIVKSGAYVNLLTNEYDYTLINKKGDIYRSGWVKIILPDTLR